jgi:hypothetical protein
MTHSGALGLNSYVWLQGLCVASQVEGATGFICRRSQRALLNASFIFVVC